MGPPPFMGAAALSPRYLPLTQKPFAMSLDTADLVTQVTHVSGTKCHAAHAVLRFASHQRPAGSGTVAWQYTQLRLGTLNGGALSGFALGAYSAARALRSEAAVASRTSRYGQVA